MKVGWIVGFAAMFILTTLVCTVGEMKWIGDEAAPLFVVLDPFGSGGRAWITAIGDMVLFRYTYLDGGWRLVRWIFLLPISIGFLGMLAITLAQGLMSAMSSAFRVVRPR